jgi:TPR repeat protein
MVQRHVLPLVRQARSGDAKAAYALGRIYLEGGAGLARNPSTAYEWLRRAADGGVEGAVALIAESIPAAAVADAHTALPIFERAAATGCRNAQRVMAQWLLTGACGDKDPVRARSMIRMAAEAGDVGSQVRLACMYQAGDGGEIDAEQARYWFEQSARAGSLAARHALAEDCWKRGDPAAIDWLAELAGRGDVQACHRYGVMLLSLNRTAEAAQWLEKAAVRGHPEAQLAYGRLFAAPGGRAKNGVPHNYKKAASWLAKSAQAGNAQAAFDLHRLYSSPAFSLRDPESARRYLELAARGGHLEAQYLLGITVLRRDTEPDKEAAGVGWLAHAAKGGHKGAQARLEQLCDAAPRTENPERRAAVARLMQVDVALAIRLELANVLGLKLVEALCLDPVKADRGECLAVDIREIVRSARRRLVLIENDEQRALIDRAKRLFTAGGALFRDLRGDPRTRERSFRYICRSVGIDPGLWS